MALDFAAGCCGGAAGILVGYPLDTVKVRIQTQGISDGVVKYKGTLQCLSTIVKEEGFKSLYRGMSSPLYGVALMNAIGFGVYGNIIKRISHPDSISSITTAGVAAGFVQAFVCSPMELVKTQMQVRGDANGPAQVVRDILHKSGPRGIFKGLGMTIAREVPACGVYFSSYELLVRLNKDNTAWVFAAGGLSGMLSWLFTYPQDVIKSRIQADSIEASSAKYTSYKQCLTSSIQGEGHSFLTRGISSTLIRAFPVNAVTMGVVTLILRTVSEEKISAYDAVARLRLNESIYIHLPDKVEDYFKSRDQQRVRYRHNVSTIATDGPSIVQIAQPIFAVAPYRLFVENLLNAMPTRYRQPEPGEVDVGTVRTKVSLKTLVRVLDRMLVPQKRKRAEEAAGINEFNMQLVKVFTGETNFLIDNTDVFMVVPPVDTVEDLFKDDGSNILAPSILAREHGHILRKETITTSDFLLPANLLSSSNEKIYGFYYVT